MIEYNVGWLHIGFIWQIRGSTIPLAMVFAVPSAALGGVLSWLRYTYPGQVESYIGGQGALDKTQVWHALNVILGLMIAFRTSQALGRYWLGNSLVHKMRMQFFDATSQLVAFSAPAATKMPMEVQEFQYTLIRLISLIHGSALNQIKEGKKEDFNVLGISGLDMESLKYLRYCKEGDINRVEVVMHWIEQLITQNITTGCLPIPPPILSRVFHGFSQGMVHYYDARNISHVPFPFPYAQILSVLLLVHMFIAPAAISCFVDSHGWSAVITFVSVLPVWAINLIAGELEQPFGDDKNDLPLSKMHIEMNRGLLMLLDQRAQRVPRLKRKAARDIQLLAEPASYHSASTKHLDDLLSRDVHETMKTLSYHSSTCIDLSSLEYVLTTVDDLDQSDEENDVCISIRAQGSFASSAPTSDKTTPLPVVSPEYRSEEPAVLGVPGSWEAIPKRPGPCLHDDLRVPLGVGGGCALDGREDGACSTISGGDGAETHDQDWGTPSEAVLDSPMLPQWNKGASGVANAEATQDHLCIAS